MPQITINLPKKAKTLFKPSRYKILYGGRGSAKSWTVAYILLMMAADRNIRVLCVRQYQTSIKESVYQTFKDLATSVGLADEFIFQNDRILHKYTGSMFWFEGLWNNENGIRSKINVDYCWLEEGDAVTRDCWDALIPTIRKKGSEIWVTFNPQEESDVIYQDFVLNEYTGKGGAIVEKWWYYDNPWFADGPLQDEMEHMRRVDPKRARHVWDGFPRDRSEAAIFPDRWRVDQFEIEDMTDGPYLGADWGFGPDPTVLVKTGLRHNTLFVRNESWVLGSPIEMLPEVFCKVPRAKDYSIFADDSRPELISYMNGQGFKVLPALKGPGSVEGGIARLRSFDEIVVHPSCKYTQDELNLYRYKVDKKTGIVLPEIVDKNNHCIDALRYATHRLVTQGQQGPRARRFS